MGIVDWSIAEDKFEGGVMSGQEWWGSKIRLSSEEIPT